MLFKEIVFGPIHSRRLGVSLGMNLLPANGKICSFDCIYCECGYNKDGRDDHSLPSKEDVAEALETKLKRMLADGIVPDVITFAGNGEPTIHPDFASIIDSTIALRDRYFPNAKISVLSNSTRIDNQSVFEALKKVDNNILKLDSVFKEKVDLIDAPVSSEFDINKIIDKLSEFGGNVIIQTMFLRGEHNGKIVDNTTDADIEGLIEAYRKIRPEKIMIYSLDRPTPEKNLIKVEKDELELIAKRITDSTGLTVTYS